MMNQSDRNMIRKECLSCAISWTPPTPEEIKYCMGLLKPGLSGGELSAWLCLGKSGGRTVRRWIGGETPIPYAVWCMMCAQAGLGEIWGDFSR